MVAVFREVWRVLRKDGTVWLNLGDSYFGGRSVGTQPKDAKGAGEARQTKNAIKRCPYCGDTFMGYPTQQFCSDACGGVDNTPRQIKFGMKPKDLVGIPWRVALALQADGWWLRSDIVWHKPNPMPESVRDRPTRAHEYMFLLAKGKRYYYDAEAVREETRRADKGRIAYDGKRKGDNGTGQEAFVSINSNGRNKRSVWTITTQPYKGAHFATFPVKLVEPMVLASTSERGCCPECGKAWERVVEKESRVPWEERKAKGATKGSLERGYNENHGEGTDHTLGVTVRTIGWRSGCEHEAEAVPCTVLDPFGGTMTVGQVCAKHGRRFVGLDLKREYVEMGRERCASVQTAMTL